MKKFYLVMLAMLIPAFMVIRASEPPIYGAAEKNSPEYYEITGETFPMDEQTGILMKPITDLTKDLPEEGLILIPHSANNAVMSFHPETGALLDMYFIPEDGVNLSTPIEITFDGNTFFISDQLKKLVQEYDQEGQFLGTFAPVGGENQNILHNIRGMLWRENGNLLVAVAGGANAHSVAEFDPDGNYLGNFIANGAGGLDGPWDIIYRHDFNDYLVSANGSSGIHRYNADGGFIEMFATGLSFPEQMYLMSNGNVLVANFSGAAGVYEFSSTGTQLGYYSVVGGLRGVYELPDQTIIVTNSAGVHRINRDNQNLGLLAAGNSRFITLVKPAGFTISLGSGFNILIGNSANLGENLQLNGGVEPYTFSWTLQNSEWTSDEQNPSFTFEDEGLHVFSLEVTDSTNAVASRQLSVHVYLELTVDAGENQYAETGQMAVLGGEPAHHGGMAPLTILWTLEDSDWTHSDPNPEVSFAEKGEYHFTITVTDVEENTASDQMKLTVYKPLEADAGENSYILVNEDFTLGGNPTASEGIEPYIYSWILEDSEWESTDSNPVINLETKGMYQYTLTVTDSLENTVNELVAITVYEALVADAGDDHEVLVNEEFTLGGDPAASEGIEPYTYLWTLEGSDWTSAESHPTASLPQEGTWVFILSVTDAIENTASDMVTVVVEEDETFVGDITEETLSVFPNPASGNVVYIRFPEVYNGEIIVTDISGREVYRQMVDTREHELQVGGWNNGVYILKAGNREHKFIIK